MEEEAVEEEAVEGVGVTVAVVVVVVVCVAGVVGVVVVVVVGGFVGMVPELRLVEEVEEEGVGSCCCDCESPIILVGNRSISPILSPRVGIPKSTPNQFVKPLPNASIRLSRPVTLESMKSRMAAMPRVTAVAVPAAAIMRRRDIGPWGGLLGFKLRLGLEEED